MKNLFARFVREEAGQDLIEYALLASTIAILGIAGAEAIAPKLNTLWATIAGKL